jgi:hypothetical protein
MKLISNAYQVLKNNIVGISKKNLSMKINLIVLKKT